MFNVLSVKPFKLTPEEAARAKEEQEVALDELVESGRMPRKVVEDVKGRQRNMSKEQRIEDSTTSANEEYVAFVSKTFDELKELFIAKNSQYGSGEPLENLKLGAILEKAGYNNSEPFPQSCSEANPHEWLWWERMWKEASNYERKHIVHVAMHGTMGDKVDESLKDIAVYSVIKLYIYKKLCEALDKEKEQMEVGR